MILTSPWQRRAPRRERATMREKGRDRPDPALTSAAKVLTIKEEERIYGKHNFDSELGSSPYSLKFWRTKICKICVQFYSYSKAPM